MAQLRSSTFWILVPLALGVVGNASIVSTLTGTLYRASRSRQWTITASSSTPPGAMTNAKAPTSRRARGNETRRAVLGATLRVLAREGARGVTHRAVAADELDAAVANAVSELLTAGPAAVASAKELIRAVDGLALEDAIPVTSKWIAALRATPEAKEGFAAFLGKRKADWIQ